MWGLQLPFHGLQVHAAQRDSREEACGPTVVGVGPALPLLCLLVTEVS